VYTVLHPMFFRKKVVTPTLSNDWHFFLIIQFPSSQEGLGVVRTKEGDEKRI